MRAVLPRLGDDTAIISWLFERLVTDEQGRRFRALSPEDAEALTEAVLRMHERLYGVPLFGGSAPTMQGRHELRPTVRDFIHRYLASDEQFAAAIAEGSRSGP